VTIFGNGNNFRLAGDLVRRVVLCSLDANLERPELRQFNGDPVARVLADRGRYVAAVLIIVRAYHAAGCPNPCKQLASFGDWSQLIRSSLVWLGRDDPVKTMDVARADDPVKSTLAEVVTAWRKVIGISQPITAGEIKEKALSSADRDGLLLKALSSVASPPARNEIDTLRLSKWLGRHKDRIVGKLKIKSEKDSHSNQLVWWLEPV
jgi:hypothetical protein